jgi:hypothetical protein
VNLYDPCVVNLTTRSGKQLTVIWHINDLMVSCEEDFELTKFSCYLARTYGMKLLMHLGKKHNYLGMDMEFTDKGTLQVSMIMYLKNVIGEFLEKIEGRAATPAADHLFTAREESIARPLDKDRVLAFHHTVVRLLFMSTQAR